VPDKSSNFILVKKHKIANYLTNAKAWEKLSTLLEFLE